MKNHDYEVEYLDEDWGWLILGEMDSNNKFEIFIYPWGFLGDESGDEFYLWRLRLRATQKRKILGVFSAFHSIECDEIFRGVIKDMLSKDGNEFRRMDIGVVWQ